MKPSKPITEENPLKGFAVPRLYILMKGKKKTSYAEIWQMLKRQCDGMKHLRIVVSDWEQG